MKTLTILAMVAILAGAATIATMGSTLITSVVAQATDNATAGAGNMTGGNMTDANATGSISRTKG